MVKSADRSLLILECVSDENSGLTHSELSAKLHIPKSSLTSLLASLSNRNYLVYDADTRRYRIGPKVLSLAGRFMANFDLVQIGRPIVDELMATTNESSSLTIMQDEQVLNIYTRNCPHVLMRSLQVGDRAPMYATAAGRAILAFMDDEEIERYLAATTLARITPHTTTDQNKLLKMLQTIRSTRLSYCREELHEGSTAISTTVFDIYGRPTASVNVVTPTMRSTTSKEKMIESAILRAGQNFSEKLGYINPVAMNAN
jgi:DNA-binding IclR family transcriptional regulator